MKKNFFIIIAILLGMSSCSVSLVKRRYMPGYHIETLRHTDRHVIKKFSDEKSNKVNINESLQVNHPSAIKIPVQWMFESPCDEINLRNGTVIKAKEVVISQFTIQYANCDDPSNTKRTISVNKVKDIKTASGKMINPEEFASLIADSADYKGTKSRRKITGWVFGGIAMALAVIAIVFFSMMGGGGWAAIGYLAIGIIFLAIALIFAIIAMVIGLRKDKN